MCVREEGKVRIFDKRIARGICRPKKDEVTGSGEDYITSSFMLG